MEELSAIDERMRASFAEEAGCVQNNGCDAMVRLYALASEVQSLLAQADWVLDQSFPQTAAGQYLDYHAETRALTRLPAAKATGVLRFSAPSAAVTDYEIDAGSVAMTSGGVRFETTKKAVLLKGETYVDVPASAVEAGASGNAIGIFLHVSLTPFSAVCSRNISCYQYSTATPGRAVPQPFFMQSDGKHPADLLEMPDTYRTGLVRLPMPSISQRTVSPGLRNCGGSMPMPTPAGVPVAMMVPAFRVMPCESSWMT